MNTCQINVLATKLNTITTCATDIALLLIMLIGLLRLGFHETSVAGLGKLMWKQVGSAPLATWCPLTRSPLARDSFGSSLPPSPIFRQWYVELVPCISPYGLIVTLPLQVFICLNLNGRLSFSSSVSIMNVDRTCFRVKYQIHSTL